MISGSALETKLDRFYENFKTLDVDEIIESYQMMSIRTNSLENQIKDLSDEDS